MNLHIYEKINYELLYDYAAKLTALVAVDVDNIVKLNKMSRNSPSIHTLCVKCIE
jgi:hypothetical protein